MDLRAHLTAVLGADGDRRPLYAALLAATLFARTPLERGWTISQPGARTHLLPAFLSPAEGERFWSLLTPGELVSMAELPFAELAAHGLKAGGIVIDPEGVGWVISRAELRQLATGEIPGEFTAWLRGWSRLQERTAEVISRLRQSHLHVITGRSGDSQRLYLLEKSDDGTLAVPCFSSAETLAQFAQIRRLFDTGSGYTVAMLDGEACLRAASGLGAYLLLDPESPWELQLEPTLF